MKAKITMAMRIWDLVKGISTSELKRDMGLPVTVFVSGAGPNVDALLRRLSREKPDGPMLSHDGGDISSAIMRLDNGEKPQPGEIHFDADSMLEESAVVAALEKTLSSHPQLGYALASRFSAFRPMVIGRLTREYSMRNAKLAGLSALPGVIPAGDWLLPFTAAGDMIALTRNQVELFLKIAASYGLPPDMQQRVREFSIVVGGAFLWRAAARQLIGMAPAGIGLAVKSAVAYGGTYAIGRAAAAYYGSGGHRVGVADVRRFFNEGLKARLASK